MNHLAIPSPSGSVSALNARDLAGSFTKDLSTGRQQSAVSSQHLKNEPTDENDPVNEDECRDYAAAMTRLQNKLSSKMSVIDRTSKWLARYHDPEEARFRQAQPPGMYNRQAAAQSSAIDEAKGLMNSVDELAKRIKNNCKDSYVLDRAQRAEDAVKKARNALTIVGTGVGIGAAVYLILQELLPFLIFAL